MEKWALVAEAGALTEPHQDSHGYGTFITVNQGRIGFGWLLQATEADHEAWCQDPLNYIGGHWRYVVMSPGETVYFPAGTVHFVFRLPSDGHTLAFGGHVLRNSTIDQWVKAMLDEQRTDSLVTNEDLSDVASCYLKTVQRYVTQAQKAGAGAMAKWGGQEVIREFLMRKNTFEQNVKAKKSKRSKTPAPSV